MTALVWCPFPDEDSAAAVATRLLDDKLIACANILGSMRALYEWNGERGDAREVGVLFKTDASLLDAASRGSPSSIPTTRPLCLAGAATPPLPQRQNGLRHCAASAKVLFYLFANPPFCLTCRTSIVIGAPSHDPSWTIFAIFKDKP